VRKIALVGFSPRTVRYIFGLPPDVEIWSVNNVDERIPEIPRLDRVIDIHTYEHIRFTLLKDKDAIVRHNIWLEKEHDFPVFMQEKFEDFPASKPYPLDDALALSSKKRLTSSFAYLLAMAILELERGDRVYVYGFDMQSNSEYAKQLPEALYWIGYAEAKGLEIIGAPESLLILDKALYGYEMDDMIPRQYLERKAAEYTGLLNESLEGLHQWKGILADRGRREDPPEEINEAFKAVQTCTIETAKIDAAVAVYTELIEVCDLKE